MLIGMVPAFGQSQSVTVQFSDWYYSVKEGTKYAVIEVRLSEKCADDVKVKCAISDGSATSGVDYKEAGTIDLTISKNSLTTTFQIEILEDDTFEYDETVIMDLSLTGETPVYVALGEISQSVLAIQDATEPPIVSFSPEIIYVLKGDSIELTTTASPKNAAGDVSYDVIAYDVDGDEDNDTIATLTPGTPNTTSGETVIDVKGDIAGTSKIRALYQSLEIASVDLVVVTVDFSPSALDVPLAGDSRLTVIVVPETAMSQITVESLATGVATYSGDLPNLSVHGESEDTTTIRAFLGAATAQDVSVKVEKKTVTLKLDGPFVIVSPNTVAAGNRPSAKLTITLNGKAMEKADITLTSAGNGEVTFETNPVKDVTVGTPQTILVFGKTASSGRDGTKIEARIDSKATDADATAPLTVIKGVKVWFVGHFECRLATNPANSDSKSGFGGWTRRLTGEPDFDRIIRFSGPKVKRALAPDFKPVVVKKITAQAPADVSFTSGDSVLGLSVDLGSDNFFAGTKEGFDDAVEPIANFKISVGNAITGAESQGVNYATAARMKLQEMVVRALKLGEQEGGYLPMIQTPVAFRRAREKALLDGQANAKTDDEKADYALRLALLGSVAQFYGATGKYEITIPDTKASVANIGDSQVLKLLKIRLDNNQGYTVIHEYYAFDGDILWGRVQGDIKLDNP